MVVLLRPVEPYGRVPSCQCGKPDLVTQLLLPRACVTRLVRSAREDLADTRERERTVSTRRSLQLIGIGPGGIDHVTVEAIQAIATIDVFVVVDKGEHAAEPAAVRTALLDRYASARHRVVTVEDPKRAAAGTYTDTVAAWHSDRSMRLERSLGTEIGEAERAAILVWGDPSLYDSTIRLVEQINGRGEMVVDITVIAGVSSVQLLAARHRIVLNRIGRPLLVTTGRHLSEHGFPEGVDDVVVMLDGDVSFRRFVDHDMDIYWAAYLGMDGELLVAGRLPDVAGQIIELRSSARHRRGWIFDIYLLRRNAGH
jgi:precorrin-6A synthase